MITATNPEKSLQIRMKNFWYGQFNEHSVITSFRTVSPEMIQQCRLSTPQWTKDRKRCRQDHWWGNNAEVLNYGCERRLSHDQSQLHSMRVARESLLLAAINWNNQIFHDLSRMGLIYGLLRSIRLRFMWMVSGGVHAPMSRISQPWKHFEWREKRWWRRQLIARFTENWLSCVVKHQQYHHDPEDWWWQWNWWAGELGHGCEPNTDEFELLDALTENSSQETGTSRDGSVHFRSLEQESLGASKTITDTVTVEGLSAKWICWTSWQGSWSPNIFLCGWRCYWSQFPPHSEWCHHQGDYDKTDVSQENHLRQWLLQYR